MGVIVEREQFEPAEYELFGQRLQESLLALRELLAQPGFGAGETTIGAEVEMHLVDRYAQPAKVNAQVLESARDPRLTLELNRFNIEINTPALPLAGHSLSALHSELSAALAVTQNAAATHDAREVMVGILPTLRMAHLNDGALSDAPRYRALSRLLREKRGMPFDVNIKGRESLHVRCESVALEGANASFQVHLRVRPEAFANAYNAAQLAAGPIVAATGNSPLFDGKWLWEETRVALFPQAVDTRVHARERTSVPARVPFGHGWIRSAYEPFAENVALHEVLLPALGDEAPLATLRSAKAPALSELRLHHGTVWNWNRAVYDPQDGGHLRIEHRLLPSGPTVRDMVANAALTLGLTLALSERMDELVATLPFSYAEQNMVAAAKYGLNAQLFWPSDAPPSPRRVRARELVLELLPVAERALVQYGVCADEARGCFALLEKRCKGGRTGAWMQRALTHRLEANSRATGLSELVQHYIDWSRRDVPVHDWRVG